ncbi:MAG: type II secretion system secretin GspD [Gammaproteobacteria bacterium]
MSRATSFSILLALVLLAAGMGIAVSARAAAEQQTGGSEITLNLKDADIRQVAQLVSTLTGKNFIVDPRVQGRVTVISAKPISTSAVFSVFLSVLEVHGLAAVPSGNDIWKIIPAVEGRQEPDTSPTLLGKVPNDALITEVIQLDNVQVSQLVAALRPLMSSYAQLAAYAPSNALIISDRAGNVARIIRLAHQLDQPPNSAFDLIHLQYATAVDIAQVLASMLQNSASSGKIPIQLAADPRTNSILITGSPEERLKVKALIVQLDQPAGGGSTQVLYLHYAEAKDIAKILQDYIKTKEQTTAAGKTGGSASPTVAVSADTALNALIVTGPPKDTESIRSIISQLDVRRAQVLVQGIIAELSSNAAAQLGISWAAASSAAGGLTNFPNGIVDLGQAYESGSSGGGTTGTTGTTDLSSSIPGGLLFGIGRIVSDGTSFVALLNALSSNSSTNILSTPSLVTLDNQAALLISGQQVPLVTGQYTNTSGASQSGSSVINPFQTVQQQQLGIQLKIKPQINYGGDTVTLNIDAKDSTLGTVQPGTTQPSVNNREVKTTVITKNKQILVLGGLIDTQLQESKQKVPFLGDIPLLGNLFRYTSSTKTRDNLMVFLRPVILRNEADTAEETTPRYNEIRELQMSQGTKVPLLPGVTPPVLPVLTTPSVGQAAEAATLLQPTPASTHPTTAPAATTNHGNGG